jgi:hypothetical protein
MPIEKTVTKRPLESLRERENSLLESTPFERLAAIAVIFQPQTIQSQNSKMLDFIFL